MRARCWYDCIGHRSRRRRFRVFNNDVYYVPSAEYGLLSPAMAQDQVFEIDFDPKTMTFIVSRDGKTVIKATKQQGLWGFFSIDQPTDDPERKKAILVNYTVADVVASLMLWHRTCDACHVGKQRQKPHKKKLSKTITAPNQVVYADLMFRVNIMEPSMQLSLSLWMVTRVS
ncbi:TPA: hypothetical protein N0F65_010596 [Lagenidium giganteum]|uniref:Uncharacterized protein n=1 Tax=Lagenidium giganteum TaxID=4803 RepID=A0AAV2Z934_9STRA|nr:TPA: hypothetical protein N0F65_010596 [Lagenidium giganteum]